jgi:hypothetical protein
MANAIARRGQFTSPVKTRYRTRLVKVGRAGLSAAARAAREEKHTIAAVGAAAVLGFMKREGVVLPKVDALGTAGTYGAIAWLAGRYMKSTVMQHVATGLLSVAAAEMASGASVSGDDEDTGAVDVDD